MNLRDAYMAAAHAPPTELRIEGLHLGNGEPAVAYVRALSLGEVIAQQQDIKDEANKPALARGFCRVAVNPDNTPCFNPDDPDDVQRVLTLPWPIVQAVLACSAKLNGLTPEAVAEAKKA
jgi:hypothetical protein